MYDCSIIIIMFVVKGLMVMKEFLEQYIGATPAAVVERLLPALVVLIVCGIVIKIVKKLVRKIIVKSKLRKGLYTFVEKTISVILYFVTFLIIADMLNIPITSLLAMFSVVGLAASLAVQDTLSNLASGVVILATHPFKTGDYVDVSNVSGTVKEINFTHTVLTTIDERVIRVPNKDVAGATIVNYSENFYRRVCIDFDVSYNANTKRVLSIIDEVIHSTPHILTDRDIFNRVTAYKDSSIKYTVRVWTENKYYWDVYFDLLDKIKERFDEAGIEIPYNQLDVHVHNV